jgi:hypothetical protein
LRLWVQVPSKTWHLASKLAISRFVFVFFSLCIPLPLPIRWRRKRHLLFFLL